jgi:hypothetical protein
MRDLRDANVDIVLSVNICNQKKTLAREGIYYA